MHSVRDHEVCCLLPGEYVVPDFTVQENTAESAAVSASPLTDIGDVSVPYCSTVVQ